MRRHERGKLLMIQTKLLMIFAKLGVIGVPLSGLLKLGRCLSVQACRPWQRKKR